MVRILSRNSGYFVCYDNDKERDALVERLRREGYLIEDVSHHYHWKEGRYNYSPLMVDTVHRNAYGTNTIHAACLCSQGVRSYTPREFLLMMDNDFKRPLPDVLFHIPHDGGRFPEELMSGLIVSEAVFTEYHEKMRDTGVFSFVPAAWRHRPHLLSFEVSRLLCDVERFTGPEEVMEEFGMGFCYRKAYDGKEIKRVSPALKDAAMVYYRRHHDALDAVAERSGNLLLIDLHSFSEETIPRGYMEKLSEDRMQKGDMESLGAESMQRADGAESMQRADGDERMKRADGAEGLKGTSGLAEGELNKMPEVCIGADPKYTPEFLTEAAECLFTEAGFRTAVNYPYQGCMVPNAVLNKRTDGKFAGIMIEVNKKVYLDANREVMEENAGRIREVVKRLIEKYEEEEMALPPLQSTHGRE